MYLHGNKMLSSSVFAVNGRNTIVHSTILWAAVIVLLMCWNPFVPHSAHRLLCIKSLPQWGYMRTTGALLPVRVR